MSVLRLNLRKSQQCFISFHVSIYFKLFLPWVKREFLFTISSPPMEWNSISSPWRRHRSLAIKGNDDTLKPHLHCIKDFNNLLGTSMVFFRGHGSTCAGSVRGIYFHRKLKLCCDALQNFQNFSEILNFKMHDWVKFLEILVENSCFWAFVLMFFVFFCHSIHVFQEKLWFFWKNRQNFSENGSNFETLPWWIS